MGRVTISREALDVIRDFFENYKSHLDFAPRPAVIWVTGDPFPTDFRPRVGVAAADDQAPKDCSVLICDGVPTEVLNMIPSEVTAEGSFEIILNDGALQLRPIEVRKN